LLWGIAASTRHTALAHEDEALSDPRGGFSLTNIPDNILFEDLVAVVREPLPSVLQPETIVNEAPRDVSRLTGARLREDAVDLY
jgi:hypothetical protein